LNAIGKAMEEGLQERKSEKEEKDREKMEQEKVAVDKGESKKEEA
jgi:small subunit ribosomal protein S2